MPSAISSGNGRCLAIVSHKGGTGRTTIALGLAWAFGQQGQRVLLVDADPTGAALLTACDEAGVCRWKNVRVCAGLPTPQERSRFDLILIDSPSLHERAAVAVLRFADLLLLSCLADPLALRTLPVAIAALQQLRQAGGRGALAGIVINMFDDASPLQRRLVQQISAAKSPPLLGTPIPLQASLGSWALHPGTPLPAGPARAAILELALMIQERSATPKRMEAIYA